MSTYLIRGIRGLETLSYVQPAFPENSVLKERVEPRPVNPDSVGELLEYRHNHGIGLLEAIDRLGLAQQDQRPEFVASQLGIPFVHVKYPSAEASVWSAFPAALAIRHRAFPPARVNGHLVVASEEDISRLMDNHFLVLELQSLISELGEDVRLRTSDINIRPLEHGAEDYCRIEGKMVWQRMLAAAAASMPATGAEPWSAS